MISLPLPPRSYTTRQIRCISCDEPFVVAENFFEQNQRMNKDGHHQQEAPHPVQAHSPQGWRSPPDDVLLTNLRQVPARQRRPITTQTQAQPNTTPKYSIRGDSDFITFVNCPRCGADNRNWVQLLSRPTQPSRFSQLFNTQSNDRFFHAALPFGFLFMGILIAYFGISLNRDLSLPQTLPLFLGVFVYALTAVFILSFENQLFNNIARAGMVSSVVLFSLTLALIAYTMTYVESPANLLSRSIPIAFATFLVSVLTAVNITAEWPLILRQWRVSRWLPNRAPRFFTLPPVLLSFGYLLIFAILGPLFLFIVTPALINFINTAGEGIDQPTAPISAAESLEKELDNWLSNQSKVDEETEANVTGVLTSLREFLDSDTDQAARLAQAETTHQSLTDSLPKLPEGVRFGVKVFAETLDDFIDEGTAVQDAETALFDEFPWIFLNMWIVFVTVAGFMTTAIAIGTVNQFALTINQQLPPPIYYSVANMTRVVAWEAMQALEIKGNMEHIQWMDVQRNNLGGINLIGLHRDPPAYDVNGRQITDLLPAQRYTVITNQWGRIQEAYIEDRRVTPTVGAPGFVVPKENFNPLQPNHNQPLHSPPTGTHQAH
jgi:hypothetical protein